MTREEKTKLAHSLVEDEPDDAFTLITELLNEDPNDPLCLFLLGYIFLKAEKLGIAYNIYKRVVELAPHRAEAWNNLGRCIQDDNKIPEAKKCFNKVLELEPESHTAYANLAVLAVQECKPHRAIELANKSLAIKSDHPQALENRSLANLLLGNYGEGWDDYDYLLGKHNHRREKQYCEHYEGRWEGSPGFTVVVYGEQGLGDEIMFASCLPDMEAKKIIVDCDSRLQGLFQRSFPHIDVYGTRRATRLSWPLRYNIDASIAAGSLPRFYRRERKDFPGTPYLIADPERRVQWRALLDSLGPELKIGIAWNGGNTNTGAFARSIGLESWEPILKQKAHFISLEYKDPTDEIKGYPVHHWKRACETDDYDDTAALVAELDLVISVTTTVVHLAGALGKECWCLTPNKPNWRFGLKGGIPWHNSVQLVRQKDSWEQIIHQIAGALNERLNIERLPEAATAKA